MKVNLKTLRRTQFGNPALRQTTRKLTKEEILSAEIQQLIKNMRHTLKSKKYGVGLAAPQVDKSIALSVIYIRPTKTRKNLPKLMWANLVIINPEIISKDKVIKIYWEGCLSLDSVLAKVPRHQKIKLRYSDEKGVKHEKYFSGLLAHVIQHEIDHLNGILFVDKVKDPKTYTSLAEYKKRILPEDVLEQYK